MAQPLGLFDAIRNIPSGTVVIVHIRISVCRRGTGRSQNNAVVRPTNNNTLTRRMTTTEVRMSEPTNAFMTK